MPEESFFDTLGTLFTYPVSWVNEMGLTPSQPQSNSAKETSGSGDRNSNKYARPDDDNV